MLTYTAELLKLRDKVQKASQLVYALLKGWEQQSDSGHADNMQTGLCYNLPCCTTYYKGGLCNCTMRVIMFIAAAAKEEAEQADKQRREAEQALRKEEEDKQGSAAPGSTLTPEDTVNTGSQNVQQASLRCLLTQPKLCCYLLVCILYI